MNTCWLTPFFGEKQPEVQLVVATNEDADKFSSYKFSIMPTWLRLLMDRMLGKIDPNDTRLNGIIESGKSQYKAEIDECFAEYEAAVDGNDANALIDFIEKMKNLAAKELNDMRLFTQSDIPVFDYNEIMPRIMNNLSFNPVTGKNEEESKNLLSEGANKKLPTILEKLKEIISTIFGRMRSGGTQ